MKEYADKIIEALDGLDFNEAIGVLLRVALTYVMSHYPNESDQVVKLIAANLLDYHQHAVATQTGRLN